ncbi:MAG TPA: MmgE/PrpD family protein [Casimicrobiaceae bacterium]|nr:MmgE/PrpD family protein [Casimicrobiaceae bacterium]
MAEGDRDTRAAAKSAGRAPRPANASAGVCEFVGDLAFRDLPTDVVAQAQRCLIDLIGVAAAGNRTQAAAIADGYAATQMCGSDRDARILFDGRRASLAGAAFAGASTIDAIDAHDGHPLTKGHVGAAILPALLAVIDGAESGEPAAAVDGREILTSLVIGYEIATRAGIALHATAPDYHCSGAWNALGCASVAARLLALDAARIREALGVAEYFGPRGQMLRTCDSPTMVKDGTGWGAHAGVSAALLAREGFTGAPAVTVEREDARQFWGDLGTRWRIREQYFKAYPVCRWAQPAVEAALALQRAHKFAASEVTTLSVESFREAIALGSARAVAATTEDAQYSLRLPIAAALVFGAIGPAEVSAPRLADPRVERLQRAMTLTEDHAFSRLFPAERWARVRVTLADGRTLASEPAVARGSAENPLPDSELLAKYRSYAEPVLGKARAARIEHAAHRLASERMELTELLDDLLQPTA